MIKMQIHLANNYLKINAIENMLCGDLFYYNMLMNYQDKSSDSYKIESKRLSIFKDNNIK